MKILKSKKTKRICTATYEKRCECCGRKFKATYPVSDYHLAQTAKDMVNSHYNAHKLFCNAEAAKLKISA